MWPGRKPTPNQFLLSSSQVTVLPRAKKPPPIWQYPIFVNCKEGREDLLAFTDHSYNNIIVCHFALLY